MDFRVLGPIEVVHHGQPVRLSAAKLRLLAVLLCRAGGVVSTGQLVAALRCGHSGEMSKKVLHVQVHRLRRALGDHAAITYRPPGYLLTLAPDELDLLRFEGLVEQGRRALAAGDHRQAGPLLRQAIGLWQGPAFAGLHDVPLLHEEAARLAELRVAATEDLVDAELALGRDADLVAELRPLVDEHPLRERLRAQLMLALYRSGRQAEALEVFREARRVLVDELGIEPGAELRRLEHAMLTGDPALDDRPDPVEAQPAATEPAVRPDGEVAAQLPHDIADFTGRGELVGQLVAGLTPPTGGEPPTAMAVWAVAGRGGVGKTTLALHVAHRLRTSFVGGQLYVNLAGTTAEPADPAQVLARFLRALGVDSSAIPAGAEERAELYRQRLASRRILVVLDDAAHEAQVRPLLPGSPTCAVVVTSRALLTGLAGSRHVRLDEFDVDQALDLLGRVAGGQRIAAEPAAAREIVQLCGHLPLAIRIAGARLVARPRSPLATLAAQLTDAGRRLDLLATGDLGVRACFALSYRALPEPARRAFRLLGTLDVPDFAGWVPAALLDLPVAHGEHLTELLVDAQLLDIGRTDPTTGAVRYHFHDLVRVYARERAEAEEPADRRAAAFARAGGGWLALAEAAGRRLPAQTLARVAGTAHRWRPDPAAVAALVSDPFGWFDAEHPALRSVVTQAARSGLAELTWELAESLECYYELRDRYDEGQQVHRLALDACRRAGNRRGEAVVLRNLASLWTAKPGASREQRREYAEAALAGFREYGEHGGEADALCLCGDSYRVGGDHRAALAALREAVAVAGRAGHRAGELHAWQQICGIHRERGDYQTAAGYAQRCVALSQKLGSSRDLGVSLMLLGIVRREQGEASDSESCFRRGIAVCTEAGDQAQVAYLYAHLGQLHARYGHPAARRTLERAEQLSRDRSLMFGLAMAVHGLGEVDCADGRYDHAAGRLAEAAVLWRRSGYRFALARTLKRLGSAHAATGDRDAAERAWREARELYLELDNPSEVDELAALLAGGAGG
jgi:DNA-binding SARP family transcriptional activator